MKVVAKRLILALQNAGYNEVSKNSSHHKYRNKDGKIVIVPYTSLHDDLAIGTVKAVLRQSGIEL
ncbi:type II toxin-antitoxin system HicA family toxin [Limosilactobacillus reuteri]|uniref:YcfA family protein n=1 Tax=Limosilactobacillus reuteri subsp. rodentium (strain DSM 17509 / CIP 109821 / 100-23) TaxID=349123 RepID=B3XQ21_LIMR1|nr:type II toxin-antitoxin system HicA family toxin [Limosilactobacillus reuteri]EDX41622.1 YcfA family protein [Limosilactobacillus reuteri subsp. rodentium]MCC4475315.1 type II toxin-antitoxin system HicA family toxin [Limosilactobacillus reuteri]